MAKKLYVAVCAYTGHTHAETSRCLMESMLDAMVRGWRFEYRTYPGVSIISRARNTVVSDFLQSDASDLILIDADVAWEPGAMCRIAAPEVDVVAGVYPHRADPLTWPIRWLVDRPYLIADPATGLLEVDGVPAGFMRISRACLERMTEHYADRWYNDAAAITKKSVALFHHELAEHELWGEDIWFCRLWREIGGKVWIDPNLTLQHIGYKTFLGSIGDWLKARPGGAAGLPLPKPPERPMLIDDTPIMPVPVGV